MAQSVRARLENQARETRRPFQEVLQLYGLERFLYRLSLSRHCEQFVLKGSLMLRVWEAPSYRPTRDIDLLGHTENSVANLERVVREVCAVSVDDDGLWFEPETVAGQVIKEDAEYSGVRVKFQGLLDRSRIPMQIDVGFGDQVYPSVEWAHYPTLLDQPAPRLRMYPRETAIAEKFQAMVYLGMFNSRLKDFYDVWLLCQAFDFDGVQLSTAVANTFKNRNTLLEREPVAFTPEFLEVAQKQWAAFLRKGQYENAPKQLVDVVHQLKLFLLPLANALIDGEAFPLRWTAPGPWDRAVKTRPE